MRSGLRNGTDIIQLIKNIYSARKYTVSSLVRDTINNYKFNKDIK